MAILPLHKFCPLISREGKQLTELRCHHKHLGWWWKEGTNQNHPSHGCSQAPFTCLELRFSDWVWTAAFIPSSPFLHIILPNGKHLCLVRKPQISFICFMLHLMFSTPEGQGQRNEGMCRPQRNHRPHVRLTCGRGFLALCFLIPGYVPDPVKECL